ncbi:MAG: hypothetical protein LBD32_01455 [Cytophagales bacterium]|jgi:hypothetical protein|nr:hypothetical protein [Cytophagales bacterium]
MSSGKRLFVSLGILSCIFWCCGGAVPVKLDVPLQPQIHVDSTAAKSLYVDLTVAESPKVYFSTLIAHCVKNFKNTLVQETDSGIKDWANRGRRTQDKMSEAADERKIDHVHALGQEIRIQILNAGRENIKLPEDPGQFLIQIAVEIANFRDPEQQREYWGNLEFYLACYALGLLWAIEGSLLSEYDKVGKYREVIDSFYLAYEKAFEIISGIKLEFRKMCEKEVDYNFVLFSYQGAGDLILVKGVPIMVMEFVALLMVNPITGEPVALATLGRGVLVSTAKELGAADSFENDPFLISFALKFCNYVRSVINRINEKLVCFKVPFGKVPMVQENPKFLTRVFREVIDLGMDDIVFLAKMIIEENGKFFLVDNKFVKIENGKVVFVKEKATVDGMPYYRACLNVDLLKMGGDVINAANDTLKKTRILIENPKADPFPIELHGWKSVKIVPL